MATMSVVRTAHEAFHGVLYELLGFAVERRGRLVEQQHARVADEGPRDRDPLPLPAREPRATLADDRVPAVGHGVNDLERIGGAKRLEHDLVRDLGEAIGDVLADGPLEQHRLLRHHRDSGAEGAQVEALHVDPVEQQPSAGRPKEAEHDIEQRRLARPGGADEGDGLAGRDGEIDAVERGSPRLARSGTEGPRTEAPRSRPATGALPALSSTSGSCSTSAIERIDSRALVMTGMRLSRLTTLPVRMVKYPLSSTTSPAVIGRNRVSAANAAAMRQNTPRLW